MNRTAFFPLWFPAAVCLCQPMVAVPVPAPMLLPTNTILVLTVPDWAKARTAFEQHPLVEAWQRPEMNRFRERLAGQASTNLWRPIEEDWGLRVGEWLERIEGQFTFALIRSSQIGSNAPTDTPWVMIADCGNHADEIPAALARAEECWRTRNREVETRWLGNRKFVAVRSRPEETGQKTGTTNGTGSVILVGQAHSVLLIGNDESSLGEVLQNLAGAGRPTLGALDLFQQDWTNRLASGLAYAWIDATAVEALVFGSAQVKRDAKEKSLFGPDIDRIVRASGLAGLRTLSLTLKNDSQGTAGEVFLRVPAAERAGIFRILVAEAKDAGPPDFVGEDVVRFRRWRLDIPRAWKAFESAFARAFPQAAGMLGLTLEYLGRDRDPGAQLRSDLLGLLGDDLIACEFSPTLEKPAPLYALPSVVLVSSPDPDRLASTVTTTFMSFQGLFKSISTQQVNGVTTYSLRLAPTNAEAGVQPWSVLRWSVLSNWLAFSTHTGLVERLVPNRGGGNLLNSKGVQAAAVNVGGWNDGVFGYNNTRQLARLVWTRFRQDPKNLDRWADRSGIVSLLPGDTKEWRSWVDVSLLPPFEAVEDRFGLTVYTQVLETNGIGLRFLMPPPGPVGTTTGGKRAP